jgi:inorganic pyrophosphatase
MKRSHERGPLDFSTLPPVDDEGVLRMVVETPRGASVKLAYDAAVGAFTVTRALALGITYPFDWGFVPGTLADDGDPLDALALHDSATFPGVILPCRPLGVVDVTQRGKNGREDNPRLILIPTWHDRLGQLQKARGLPPALKRELEQFFVSATFFTHKDVRVAGWRGPDAAMELVGRLRRDTRRAS